MTTEFRSYYGPVIIACVIAGIFVYIMNSGIPVTEVEDPKTFIGVLRQTIIGFLGMGIFIAIIVGISKLQKQK